MPPPNKPQPTAEELGLLRAWIAGEALSFGAPEPEVEAIPEVAERKAVATEPCCDSAITDSAVGSGPLRRSGTG